MTIEEFDKKLTIIGDEFIEEIKKLQAKFQEQVKELAEQGQYLPKHLVQACAQNLYNRIEAVEQEFEF